MRPRILITGGAGLLAVNWAAAIRDQFTVTLGLHTRQITMSKVSCRVVPLHSVDVIASAIRDAEIEIVIHCAAMTNVEACESAPQAANFVNVEIARNVAYACESESVKLVHISTDHIFDGIGSMNNEESKAKPLNTYAKTKLAAETAVLDVCPDAIVARTNFFGWGLSYRKSFSDTIIEALRNHRQVELFSDAYFTPILMDKLIMATHDLLSKGVMGIFHLAGDERVSKYEFGMSIAKIFNLDAGLIKPAQLANRSDLTLRPLDMSLDNQKLCTVLGRRIGSLDDQLAYLRNREDLRLKI